MQQMCSVTSVCTLVSFICTYMLISCLCTVIQYTNRCRMHRPMDSDYLCIISCLFPTSRSTKLVISSNCICSFGPEFKICPRADSNFVYSNPAFPYSTLPFCNRKQFVRHFLSKHIMPATLTTFLTCCI